MINVDIDKKLLKEVRNGHFERDDEGGLYLPKSQMGIQGYFTHDVYRQGVGFLGEQVDKNMVVNEGLDEILEVHYRNQTQITAWYVGIYENNPSIVATLTASDIGSTITECTAYTESTREVYTIDGAPSSQTITNSASKATFNMNATKTVYGAFLVSVSTKGAATGVLNSISAFSASRDLVNTDQLLITYTLTTSNV